MTEARLRIGIIGIGWYAAGAVVPQLQKTDRVEIAALARRNPERLALAQRALNVSEVYTDWREMLDCAALDAVAVCTPNNAHVEPALAALERGLHAFVEKPLALRPTHDRDGCAGGAGAHSGLQRPRHGELAHD